MSDLKPFDPTRRCKHCGDFKAGHHKRAPYKCPTRLKEGYWEPWASLEEYEEAARVSRERAEAIMADAKRMRECPFCRMQHTVVVPTVHSNGTSAKDLFEQLDGAVIVLHEAQRALAEAAPNGRDYYTQAAGATEAALGAHERRCRQLNDMLAELTEMRDHVQEVVYFEAERKAAR